MFQGKFWVHVVYCDCVLHVSTITNDVLSCMSLMMWQMCMVLTMFT